MCLTSKDVVFSQKKFVLTTRQEFSIKKQWGCQGLSLLGEALGLVNIVNSNTFFLFQSVSSEIIVSKFLQLQCNIRRSQKVIKEEGLQFLA